MSLQITARSMPMTPSIEAHIRRYYQKISKRLDHINHCRVVIDLIHKKHFKGKIFNLSVDLLIPGKEVVCQKQGENLHVTIREAFETLRHLLQKYMEKNVA